MEGTLGRGLVEGTLGITNGYITCHVHYPKENNSKTHIFWIMNMNICMYMHLSSVYEAMHCQ